MVVATNVNKNNNNETTIKTNQRYLESMYGDKVILAFQNTFYLCACVPKNDKGQLKHANIGTLTYIYSCILCDKSALVSRLIFVMHT